jgi:tryptophan 2,3-dioxygenase
MTDPRDRKPDDPMAGIHWDLDRSMSHAQYLRLDRVLGARHFEVHAADPPVPALLRRELPTPSLYNEALRLLARRGFEIPPERTERD